MKTCRISSKDGRQNNAKQWKTYSIKNTSRAAINGVQPIETSLERYLRQIHYKRMQRSKRHPVLIEADGKIKAANTNLFQFDEIRSTGCQRLLMHRLHGHQVFFVFAHFYENLVAGLDDTGTSDFAATSGRFTSDTELWAIRNGLSMKHKEKQKLNEAFKWLNTESDASLAKPTPLDPWS